jgi:hypothetical protein
MVTLSPTPMKINNSLLRSADTAKDGGDSNVEGSSTIVATPEVHFEYSNIQFCFYDQPQLMRLRDVQIEF